MIDESTQRGWVTPLIGPCRTPERLDLAFEGCHVEVRSNSRRLMETLAYYFKDFLVPGDRGRDILVAAVQASPLEARLPYIQKPPGPGKSRVKEEYADLPGGRVVRKLGTGMVFFFGQGENVAYGPCTRNANQVINFINNRFIQHTLSRGFLLGHASAVLHGGRGVAVAGHSGAGKSTLALHLMSRGAALVSNDRLMVRRQGVRVEMMGVAKLPRVNPGTLLTNPSLARVMPEADRVEALKLDQDELWSREQKYDVFIDQCFGPGRFKLKGPMDGLLLLSWERGGGPLVLSRATGERRAQLLPAFVKPVGLFYRPEDGCGDPAPTLGSYLDALGPVEVLELAGGVDFEAAADAAWSFMQTGRVAQLPGPRGDG